MDFNNLSEEQQMMLLMKLFNSKQFSIDPKDKGAVGMESVLKREKKFTDIKNQPVIQVRKGDMTKEKVDAITNAANGSLQHISGLAGAILSKGGQVIQDESDEYLKKLGHEVKEGGVVPTTSGKLPCKKVFHAVGPIWGWNADKNSKIGTQLEDKQLEKCILNCLELTEKYKFSSVSIPAISSGIFGFPKDRCAKILFGSTITWLQKNPNTTVKEVRFTNFDDTTVEIFEKEYDNRFGKPTAKESKSTEEENKNNDEEN